MKYTLRLFFICAFDKAEGQSFVQKKIGLFIIYWKIVPDEHVLALHVFVRSKIDNSSEDSYERLHMELE